MLLVEQNMTLALDLADRAYVLRTGEVRLEGRRRASCGPIPSAIAQPISGRAAA